MFLAARAVVEVAGPDIGGIAPEDCGSGSGSFFTGLRSFFRSAQAREAQDRRQKEKRNQLYHLGHKSPRRPEKPPTLFNVQGECQAGIVMRLLVQPGAGVMPLIA